LQRHPPPPPPPQQQQQQQWLDVLDPSNRRLVDEMVIFEDVDNHEDDEGDASEDGIGTILLV
jgi:hypothetical protein